MKVDFDEKNFLMKVVLMNLHPSLLFPPRFPRCCCFFSPLFFSLFHPVPIPVPPLLFFPCFFTLVPPLCFSCYPFFILFSPPFSTLFLNGYGLLWPGLLWPIPTLASSTLANVSCLVCSFPFFVFLSSFPLVCSSVPPKDPNPEP